MGAKSTTTQKADPWKPAQPFLKAGLQDAADLYDAGGFKIDPYGGDMVARYDPLRSMGDQMAPGLAQGAMGGLSGASSAVQGAMDPNARSAGWGQVIQNTINSIMPGINSSFAGSGMTGSELHAQNLAKGLSAGVAGVENDAWQRGMDRSLAAAGMVPGLNSAGFNISDFLRGVGQERQGQEQSEISADVLKDQQAKSASLSAIQDFMALVSGVGGQFGTQSSTSKQSPGLLGILGLGLQAAPLVFSDRRVKEDIKKIGEADNGLPIYQYRYKAGGPVHIGVMAQDVQKKSPAAVKNVNGILAVDYARAMA